MSWPNGYQYRTTASIASGQITGTLSGYPALISLSSANLKTTANGGAVQNTVTQSGGPNITIPADFLVTSDAAGSTQITGVEFETYSATAGTALVWVYLASAAVGSTVYCWYGNSSVSAQRGTVANVWSGYAMVQHLATVSSAINTTDSTGNGYNGTLNNSPTVVAGEIAGAASLSSSSSQTITASGITALQGAQKATMSSWVQLHTSGAAIIGQFQPGSDTFTVGSFYGDVYWEIYVPGSYDAYPASTGGTADTNWHLVTWVFDGTQTGNANIMKIYLDGNLQTLVWAGNNAPTSLPTIPTPEWITGEYANSLGPYFSDANYEETRVSTTALSSSWIAADYQNQSAPNTFWTISYDQQSLTITAAMNKLTGSAIRKTTKTITSTSSKSSGATSKQTTKAVQSSTGFDHATVTRAIAKSTLGVANPNAAS